MTESSEVNGNAMRRPLIVGVRASGSPMYRFRVFGNPECELPPAELHATLRGLATWLSHGRIRALDPASPTLRLV
jgi:hypothetical protein